MRPTGLELASCRDMHVTATTVCLLVRKGIFAFVPYLQIKGISVQVLRGFVSPFPLDPSLSLVPS